MSLMTSEGRLLFGSADKVVKIAIKEVLANNVGSIFCTDFFILFVFARKRTSIRRVESLMSRRIDKKKRG